MGSSIWFSGFRGRMTAIMVTATVCIMALNLIVYFQLKNVSLQISNITDIRMPSIKGLEEVSGGQMSIMQTVGLMEHEDGHPERLKAHLASYGKNRDAIKEGRALYDPLPQSPDEEIEFKNFLTVWKNWEEACDKYIDAQKAGDRATATKLYALINETFVPAETSLEAIITINYKNADEDRKAAIESASHMKILCLGLGLAGAAIVILLSLIIAHRTARTLSGLAGRLDGSSNQVAEASTQLAAASQGLSESTTEQAASLQETAASLEEISAMIVKASDSAVASASSAADSQNCAKEGKVSITEMLTSINEISVSNQDIMAQISDSNLKMSEIVRLIQEIGSKTKVINEIVFQTKLLSFNASVEAARAGEHGKGFAVVAEEVGNLAQMSGNAAREITEMLEGSIKKVEQIVQETKSRVDSLAGQSQNKIQSGLTVARRCAEALDEIVTNVDRSAALATEISAATKEQSQGVNEITKAMAQLDTVTQQNSASSHEASSAADSLSTQAELLRAAVAELTYTIEGRPANAGPDQLAKVQMATVHKLRPASTAKAQASSKRAPIAAGGGRSVPDRDDNQFTDV